MSAVTVTPVFRHVVMFRWTPETTDAAKAAVSLGLAALPEQIDTLRDYRFGPDAGLAEGNWDFAIVADFDDEAGYFTYRDHEAHPALIVDVLRPIIAARAAVQHTVDG